MSEENCLCSSVLTTPLAPWCQHYGGCPKCSCNGPFICPSCDMELEDVCESVGNQRICDHEWDCGDCVCEPRWDDEVFDEVFYVNRGWLGHIDYPVIALYRSKMQIKHIAANLELPVNVISSILLYLAFVSKGIAISLKPGRRDGEELSGFEAKKLLGLVKKKVPLVEVADIHERSQISVAREALFAGIVELNTSGLSQRTTGASARQGWEPQDVRRVEALLQDCIGLEKISQELDRPLDEIVELVMKHELAEPSVWFSEFKRNYIPFNPYPDLPDHLRRN